MTRPTTADTRAAHLGPERRRPQVLDAALQIAATRGIPAVSVASVAEHLGVTRPVVYACYADRMELLRALVEREEQVLLDGAFAAMTGHGPATPAAFVAGFRALLSFVAEHPDSWRLLFQHTTDPVLQDVFGRGRQLIGLEFERLLRRSLTGTDPADVERQAPALVEMFLSSCEAAVRLLLRDDTHMTPDELGDFVGRAVHRALFGV